MFIAKKLCPAILILLFAFFVNANEVSNSSPGLIAVWHFNDGTADGISTDSGPNLLNATLIMK